MRLRDDNATSSALRLSLEDDAREFPSADAVKNLAEVIKLRINGREPVRLSVCADTPKALKAALLAEMAPAPHALNSVWESVREAIRIESPALTAPLSLSRQPNTNNALGEQQHVQRSINRPLRRKRNMAIIAVGVATVSTLAAAGLALIHVEFFPSSTEPNPQNSALQTLRRTPPRELVPPLQESRLPDLPTSLEPTTISTVARTEPSASIPSTPTERFRATPPISSRSTANSPSEQTHSTDEKNSGSVLAELQLLRPAWAELRAGHPENALKIAAEHAVRYPTGVLVQEREVVRIQALTQLGKTQEARRNAASFERRFPDSPHKPLTNADLTLP